MRRSRIWLLVGGIAAAAIVLTLYQMTAESGAATPARAVRPASIPAVRTARADTTVFVEPATSVAEQRQLAALDVDPAANLTVHVVQDEDGAPVEGARVRVMLAPALEVRSVERTTDANGLVSFAVPLAEARILTAQAAGRNRLVHALGSGAVTDSFEGGLEPEV